MSIYLTCDNKGCYKHTEALLDKKSNEVLCRECEKPIKSITRFMKSQLDSLGQITKNVKKAQAFASKCPHCGVVARPKLVEKKFYCSDCDKQLTHFTKQFEEMLRQNIR